MNIFYLIDDRAYSFQVDKAVTVVEHYDAKSATAAEVGNIEYWYCTACEKYYSDKNGNTEITKAETVLAKITPEIINGSDQKVTAGEKKELAFRSNAAFADFIRVEVDGVALDAMSYTVKENDASPTTGDNRYMALWLALLFASGSLLAVTGIFGKKKTME